QADGPAASIVSKQQPAGDPPRKQHPQPAKPAQVPVARIGGNRDHAGSLQRSPVPDEQVTCSRRVRLGLFTAETRRIAWPPRVLRVSATPRLNTTRTATARLPGGSGPADV